MHYTHQALLALDKDFRTQLINSVSGFKPANLIGTQDASGITNLAIFSSVVHLGANPPLLGMVSRPFTPTVSRHTYNNLTASGFYTINHVHTGIFAASHQTSARYPDGISEFAEVGLTPEYLDGFAAPFVAEARIKLGMRLVTILDIEANDTKFIIGEIVHLIAPDDCILPDGKLDLETAQSVAVSGLDAYHRTEQLARLPYAKPAKKS